MVCPPGGVLIMLVTVVILSEAKEPKRVSGSFAALRMTHARP